MFEFGVAGRLSVDHIATHDGYLHEGLVGGGMAYSASGARLWSSSVGLVGRLAANYPPELLQQFSSHGIDVDWLVEADEPGGAEAFFAYEQVSVRRDEKPAPHFLRAERPLPKSLIPIQQSERPRLAPPPDPSPENLPTSLEGVRGFHLAAVSWRSASLLSSRLQALGTPLITLDPPSELMKPGNREHLELLLPDIDAFLPSEKQLKEFYRPQVPALWEMADDLAGMGPRFVVVKRGSRGQVVLDREANSRWTVPAYPARVRDVTGAGHAYCGGFLVGLATTGEPLSAALHGSVAASLCVEGTGPFFLLEALRELARARLDWLNAAYRRD